MTLLTGSLSLWLLLPALIASAALAWLLYGKRSVLSRRWQYILFAFRTTVFTLVFLLLLAPLIRLVSKRLEKPLIIIAQDNSASLKISRPAGFNVVKYAQDMQALARNLSGDYEVATLRVSNETGKGFDFGYNSQSTDLSSLFRYIKNTYPARNIGAVVLASDGLYNRGSDPVSSAQNLSAAVYTVALGDTTARRDLAITQVNYNQVAYSGNDFEVEVLAEANRSKGENLVLTAKEEGGQPVSKTVRITADPFTTRIPLRLSAAKTGNRKITISLKAVSNEVTLANNTQTIYVDVLDAKRRILILSSAPHPDIAVLKQAIEINKNYEVKSATLSDWQKQKQDYKPELVILHQLPANGFPVSGLQQQFSKTPFWYITGAQTDWAAFNSAQTLLKVLPAGMGTQEVFPQLKTDFSLFTLSDSLKQRIVQFPPLLAVYGNYSLADNGAVLMQQKIGQVETKNPLLVFGGGNKTAAVLSAEGIWRWRLAENQRYGNSKAVDELISQTVQYLTAQNQQQRFRVIPAKTQFDESERVLMNAELYNESNELVNTPDVRINLKNNTQKKQYSFQFNRGDKSYNLDAGALPPGEYAYVASTQFGGKKLTENGRFIIARADVEYRQTRANHQLLYQLAKAHNGEMVSFKDVLSLEKKLRQNGQVKTIVYSEKQYREIIDLKWLFFLLMAFLTVEWLVRKREGMV